MRCKQEQQTPTPETTEATPTASSEPTDIPDSNQEEDSQPVVVSGLPDRADLPELYQHEAKNEAVDAAHAPRITTLDNGVQIQRTPENTWKATALVSSWNTVYLNADNRGCNVCHTLEDALADMDTFHGIIEIGYDTEQTFANCVGCHGFYPTKLRDSIHAIHQLSDQFAAMKGTCDFCHYIDDDGNFRRWDYVKYDVLLGLADLPADTVETSFSWNQTEVTPSEKMYYKSIKSAPSEWLTDDSQITPDLIDTWTVKVTGDVDNPFEMTVPELIETLGTETRLMKSNCVMNGPGQAMIYQAEITGIPLSRIYEYAGVHEDANMFYPIGVDGFCDNVSTEIALNRDCILVTGMNGGPVPADQGYPCAIWYNDMASCNFTKYIVELKFEKQILAQKTFTATSMILTRDWV